MIRRALAAAVGILVLSACASTTPTSSTTVRTTKPSIAQASPGTVSCTYVAASTPAKPVDPPSGTNVPATGTAVAVITTNEGPISITMDRSKTPCTVNSFLSLAQQKYFDATRCHRLVNAGLYLLQCGDPTGTGVGGPGYTFRDETYATDTFPAGTVAMANAGPNTNGSQFFLVYADTSLPPQYTVFGHMDPAGIAVVAKIAADGQDGSNNAGGGKPNNPAKILSVSLG
ncbi:MAG TPA: peptidylprolyl isomerase [Propionibacteriaceae bacterium]|nr:peptidylprolyl isomerase [Propionibacteriaceae bacterium]